MGKMQDTNGQLQKSLDKITTQNTESLNQLNAAKERARELERQLNEAKKGSGKTGFVVMTIIAVVLLIILLAVTI